ncbi:hypothetical protein POM88_047198 [Heracleum sosnowskyi]|uniref:F-box domain-containing protein n=1 Tax=Heracleum sosnowskyi TaxID=360622 RepID=A0AAD8H8V4_9APIA|nr:hypothetical protein POM88_047198 [Heracleum sosnowskyi]
MASTRCKNSSCFIPEELVFKILILLPGISILRCKSVCKTWLSIISNPQFIQTQLIESHKKQPSSVLRVRDESIYVDTRENSTLLCELPSFTWLILIVCSCNGLVCVGGLRGYDICLGNPMTRRFKKVPPPSEYADCENALLGFGFDDISNDYKILKISEFPEEDDDDSVICALQAEMYSVNDDSWKKIGIPETLTYFPISRSVCLNPKGSRFLYFEGKYELLSFDLHNEVFRVHSYPIPPLQLQLRKSYVMDFEGSVAMFFNESTNDGSAPSLWTLNEVLGNWSCTKEFNLDDGLNVIRAPLTIFQTEYNETLVSLKGFEQLE